jgi:hypothetical protein
MATSMVGTVLDLTSDISHDALKSSTTFTKEPEVIDLSSEGVELPREPLTPISPICQYSQPLFETKGRPKNGRRNFLPHAFQIKHDEIYQSAACEIATTHQSNQWHYQHMISGMDRIDALINQANNDIARNLLDAEAEGQAIDTNYILAYDQATLAEKLLNGYIRFCPEHAKLSCKFSHLVRHNTGVLSRHYCSSTDVLLQRADEWRNGDYFPSDSHNPVTESLRTPVKKRRCRSLEPPGAPVKKVRRE